MQEKGADPTDVQNPDKHNGRTQPVHKLYKSKMWTAIRGHDHIQRNERTRPGSQKYEGPRRGRIKLSKY